MGGHAGFAFGLALAQPDRKIILFDSEGDLLMSLGILTTIAEQAPKNFYHFMLDNECYATTGGQPVLKAQNVRSEEHTSELQSPMRISNAVFCLNKNIVENKKNLTKETS